MSKLFYTVIEISVPVSAVILVMMLFSKRLSKRFTAKWRYFAWLILAVRLMVPFNYHVPKPAVNVTVPDTSVTVNVPATPQQAVSSVQEPEAAEPPIKQPAKVNGNTENRTEKAQTGRTFSAGEIAAAIWLSGALVFMVYQMSKYFVFRKDIMRWSCLIEDTDCRTVFLLVMRNMKIKGNIALRRSKKISSPMMTGFFRPILFLPETDYCREELEMIIRHELVHYKRHDIWYKFIMALANAVHWFNPFVWIMSREASKDVELVCDAEVVKNMDAEYRKQYGETILSAVHKGEKCKTAFSTYFYGGVKIMKERIKNIFDTGRKHRGIAALCVVAVAALVLGIFVGTRPSQPKLKVTVGDSKTAISVNGLEKADDNSLFIPVMKKTPDDKILKISEGTQINLSFGGEKPDSVTVTDVLINSDGKYKYSEKITPESLKVTEKEGIYSFTTKKNISSCLSSESDAEKKDIYGYCITAKLGNKDYFYPFVLKLTVKSDTKTVKYNGFEISVPNKWNLSNNLLKSSVKTMCELNAIDYDPDQPFSQLYGNHSEEKSKEQITGTSYPTTKVVLRRTQPAAAQDDSYTDELHYFIIPENGRAAYDLNFNSSEVTEDEALKIVKTFRLLSSEIIENVSAEIVKQNPDIDITNEFISYDYNYIALFGSLKSDKKQGAAVVYAIDKPANKKQLLAPGKHGAVRTVQTGAKASTVDIAADDGYEWVFNVFNGFTGGHEGGKTFTSVSVNHHKILNDNDFYNLNYEGFIPEIDYASKSRVVFHGSFGLFVYDMQKQNIVQSLNLEEIGCDNIQGSEYTSVLVSKDGNTVYMDSTGNDEDDYMYKYDIDSDNLEQVPYKQINDYYKTYGDIEKVLPKLPPNADSIYAPIDNDTFAYFQDGGGSLARNLELAVYNKKTKASKVNKVFKNWPRYLTPSIVNPTQNGGTWQEVSPVDRVKATVQNVNVKNGKLMSMNIKMTDDLPENKDTTQDTYDYYTYYGKETEIYFENMAYSGDLPRKVQKGKQIIITFAQFEKPNEGQVFDAALPKWLYYQDSGSQYQNVEGDKLNESSLNAEIKYFTFLSSLDIKTNTLTADPAEYISSSEDSKTKELKLSKNDFNVLGFHVYNPKVDKKTFKVSNNARLYLWDTNTQKTDIHGMKKRIDSKKGKGAFWLTVKDGIVVKVEEQYLP